MKKIIGYKTLTNDMMSGHGNEKWKIGEWKHYSGCLELCQSGFHASKNPLDALGYVQGDRFFQVEAKGEVKEQDDKFVSSDMRIIAEIKLKELSVAFSIFCAKRVLPIFEKKYPLDNRPRKAIEAAEAWLKAKNKRERDAAGAAARAAARAAGAAARAAARAAGAAAGAAARAAGAAAGDAAWDAEKKHQRKKILELVKKYVIRR